jgi:hypothetical protein
VLEDHFLEWGDRGGTPPAIARTLKRVPWTTDDLASLLDIEPDEVADLMRLYGFEVGSDGQWRPDEAEEARLLRLLDEEVMYSFSSGVRGCPRTREGVELSDANLVDITRPGGADGGWVAGGS